MNHNMRILLHTCIRQTAYPICIWAACTRMGSRTHMGNLYAYGTGVTGFKLDFANSLIILYEGRDKSGWLLDYICLYFAVVVSLLCNCFLWDLLLL